MYCSWHTFFLRPYMWSCLELFSAIEHKLAQINIIITMNTQPQEACSGSGLIMAKDTCQIWQVLFNQYFILIQGLKKAPKNLRTVWERKLYFPVRKSWEDQHFCGLVFQELIIRLFLSEMVASVQPGCTQARKWQTHVHTSLKVKWSLSPYNKLCQNALNLIPIQS